MTTIETGGTASGSAAGALLGTVPRTPRERAALGELVGSGAYFSLFSIPNPASPTTGNPLIPVIGQALSISFNVTENIHRFEVDELEPEASCGMRVVQNMSENGVAAVHMEMVPIPNYFQAAPDRTPPPTVLLPFLSQRFTPLDGRIDFDDPAKSGFTALGAGRTFPSPSGLQPRLAAVIEVDQGYGALAGLQGTGIISGEIAPPSGFAFNVLFRIVDPGGSLDAKVPPGPLEGPSDPTPQTSDTLGTSFLPFLSEPDPDRPIAMEEIEGGARARLTIVERLRLVDVKFNVDPPGLRTKTTTGPVVGRHATTLIVDLSDPTNPLPAFSKGDEFQFFDTGGRSLGGFRADTAEARIFPTTQGGLTFNRIGGFALPTEGTGQFVDPVGMVSINGAFSTSTGAVSTLYMVRLSAPDASFKVVASTAGRGAEGASAGTQGVST